MALRFYRKCVPDQRLDRVAPAQCITQVGLDLTEKTWPQMTVRRQAHPGAAVSIMVTHRRDDAHCFARIGIPEIRGRSVPRWSSDGCKIADPTQLAEHLQRGNVLVRGNV